MLFSDLDALGTQTTTVVATASGGWDCFGSTGGGAGGGGGGSRHGGAGAEVVRPRWGFRGEVLENLARVAQLEVVALRTDSTCRPLVKTLSAGAVSFFGERATEAWVGAVSRCLCMMSGFVCACVSACLCVGVRVANAHALAGGYTIWNAHGWDSLLSLR